MKKTRAGKRLATPLGRCLSNHLALVSTTILLQACATVQPPNTVFVQVPIPCLTTNQLPIPPKLVGDAKLAALSDYDLVLQINIQRLEFEQYAKELSATLQACIK